jgi:hypothetical protein
VTVLKVSSFRVNRMFVRNTRYASACGLSGPSSSSDPTFCGITPSTGACSRPLDVVDGLHRRVEVLDEERQADT